MYCKLQNIMGFKMNECVKLFVRQLLCFVLSICATFIPLIIYN